MDSWREKGRGSQQVLSEGARFPFCTRGPGAAQCLAAPAPHPPSPTDPIPSPGGCVFSLAETQSEGTVSLRTGVTRESTCPLILFLPGQRSLWPPLALGDLHAVEGGRPSVGSRAAFSISRHGM